MASSEDVWWHGTGSGDLRGGEYGLHVGTHKAATEALTSRIGHPVHGEWDGTRRYGDTLLQGQATMRERGTSVTGHNCGAPEHDHYPDPAGHFPHDSHVTPDSTPNVFPLRIHGPMANSPHDTERDDVANDHMRVHRGNPHGSGMYYRNVGEDEGSVSAVVPHSNHIEPIARGQHGVDYHSADRHSRELTEDDYAPPSWDDEDDDWGHHHGAADEPVSLKAPDFETPACTYCGSTQLTSQENNGRADRVVCDACGGSMVAAPGDQFMPDLIGSPHNHPAQTPDGRSGGVGGASNDGVVHEMQLRTEAGLEDIAHLHGQSPEVMAKHYEAKAGPLTPVKKAGFAGYVEPYEGFHEETKEVDREAHGGAGDFHHSLYEKVAPNPTKSEMHSYENSEYGEMPERYHERHYDAYQDAVHEQQHEDAPVAHHRELGQFIGGSGMDDKLWNSKAQTETIHPHAQPIYACQSHVVNQHVGRYLRNPGDKTAFEHMKDERGEELPAFAHAYAGTHMPMMVRHEGNLFTTEGHHRTAVALHTGHPLNVSVWDADKHGLPNEDNEHEPGWGHDEYGDAYSGLRHHGALIGHGACAFGHLTGRAAQMHAFANHDDGVCSATALLHHSQGGATSGDVLATRRRDDELGFHLTATWADVRDKATRITREGGVHIAVANGDGIGGHVRGDHNVYETFLTYVPGSRKVGYWNCGCKWAAYAWGRSAPYRRFEGRMCSHALAMQFEALKQHAFQRKQVEEHDFRPAWMRDKHVVVHHQRATDRAPAVDHTRYEASLADFEPADDVPDGRAPLYAVALAGVLAGEDPGRLVATLGRFGASRDLSRALVGEALDEGWSHVAVHRHGGNPLTEFREELLMMGPSQQASGGGGGDIDGKDDHNGPADEDDKDHTHDSDDGTPDDGSGGPGEPASHQNNPLDPNHHTHKTEDSREHAPDHGWGVPDSEREPSVSCTQCNDQGCGHCSGAGQVDLDGLPRVPDQNADAGGYSRGKGVGAGGIPTFSSLGQDFAERCLALYDQLKAQGTYTSYDSGPNPDPRPETRTVRSQNPGSTGYATSADPSDWQVGQLPTETQNRDSFTAAKKPALDIPTHAGVALKAHDTGRVLMLQRSMSDEKDPARGKWEFPGGGMEHGDKTTLHGGIREWEEEVGQPFPGGVVHHTWRSGPYQGHVVMIPKEQAVDPRAARSIENPDDDNEVVAWLHPHDVRGHRDVRDEVKSGTPWAKLQSASLEKAAIALDHPEPALPTTEGGEDESTEGMGRTPGEAYRSQMTSEIAETDSGAGGGTTASLEAIVARFQASAGAAALNAPTPAQMQAGGGSSEPGGGDIAAAARAHLAKTSMKNFTEAERRALISEGEAGPRARNFSDLQIQGTHYAEIDDEELLV